MVDLAEIIVGLRFCLQPTFFCSIENVDLEDNWLTLRNFSSALSLFSNAFLMMSFCTDDFDVCKSVFSCFSPTSNVGLEVIAVIVLDWSQGATLF